MPVDSWMYLTGNFHEVLQADIYDMSGIRRVSKSHVPANEGIYAGHLAAGIYYVVVSTDRGVYRTKIVKR